MNAHHLPETGKDEDRPEQDEDRGRPGPESGGREDGIGHDADDLTQKAGRLKWGVQPSGNLFILIPSLPHALPGDTPCR